jgi:putative membrane protein
MQRRFITIAAVLALGLAGGSAALGASGKQHNYSAFDEQSLKTSIQGDRFEITGGKLAESKGASQQVKALGARLVKDHTKSLNEAIAVAHKLGISVPKQPTESQQWELQVVGKFSGQDFDHQYSLLEVQDHHQDISEATDTVDMATSAAVRKLAKTDLPTLRTHLKLSQDALKASG